MLDSSQYHGLRYITLVSGVQFPHIHILSGVQFPYIHIFPINCQTGFLERDRTIEYCEKGTAILKLFIFGEKERARERETDQKKVLKVHNL